MCTRITNSLAKQSLTTKNYSKMKKAIILSLILLMSAGVVNAQLKVANNGRVGINVGSSVPLSRLSLNCTGDTLTEISVEKTGPTTINEALSYIAQGNYSALPSSSCINAVNNNIMSQESHALKAHAEISIMGLAIGLKSSAGPSSAFSMPSGLPSYMQNLFQSKSYGVYSTAGNLTNGYNYGVFGAITGTRNGTGIYGATSETSAYISGKYAGYFYGQTYVNGNIYATDFVSSSDERLKTDISQIKEEALVSVRRLNPVQYRFQQVETERTVADTLSEKSTFFSPDMDFERVHYGFIAQEVKKLYPNLVHEDGEGYMSINYVELIPLLVMALQEMSEEIENLKSVELQKRAISETDEMYKEAVLYQNEPNPFDIATEIRYYLPAEMQNAAIYIYDMNGTQIQKHSLEKSGEGTLTIQGSELQAGMYLYSLIADGQVIDTKRMILTK